MKWNLILLLLSAIVTSCSQNNTTTLRTGDLLFFEADSTAHSSAIEQATHRDSTANYIHVAIIEICNDTSYLIEAVNRGVVRTAWDRGSETRPILIKRIKSETLARQAVERAKSYIGQSYDWYYTHDNGAMYCSELVYESYLNEDGSHIFNAIPMNFRASDGSMPEFWTELFARLGSPIPEGMPGTNPNSIARTENVFTETEIL